MNSNNTYKNLSLPPSFYYSEEWVYFNDCSSQSFKNNTTQWNTSGGSQKTSCLLISLFCTGKYIIYIPIYLVLKTSLIHPPLNKWCISQEDYDIMISFIIITTFPTYLPSSSPEVTILIGDITAIEYDREKAISQCQWMNNYCIYNNTI